MKHDLNLNRRQHIITYPAPVKVEVHSYEHDCIYCYIFVGNLLVDPNMASILYKLEDKQTYDILTTG